MPTHHSSWFHRIDWIYVLDNHFQWKQTRITPSETLTFLDKTHTPRLQIDPDGTLTIFKEYAWDGCSPKYAMGTTVVGTPEGLLHVHYRKRKTYYASLVHDALYQFVDEAGREDIYKRHDADWCFLCLLRKYRFLWSFLYYAAVWLLGGFFHRATTKRRASQGTIVRGVVVQ